MKEPKAKTDPPKLSFSKPEPASEPENPPNPNPTPDESLVNETGVGEAGGGGEEYVADPNREPAPEGSREAELEATIVQLEQQLGATRQKNVELQAKIAEKDKQKANYSDVSRKFRIFLSIIQGMTARGMFDQSELAKKPGSEHNIMRHAAGLAEVANKATENRF